MIAEKFEAMTRFGEANTRIKGFYDIWITTRTLPFELAKIVEAVALLRRREAPYDGNACSAKTSQFAKLQERQPLRTAFLHCNLQNLGDAKTRNQRLGLVHHADNAFTYIACYIEIDTATYTSTHMQSDIISYRNANTHKYKFAERHTLS